MLQQKRDNGLEYMIRRHIFVLSMHQMISDCDKEQEDPLADNRLNALLLSFAKLANLADNNENNLFGLNFTGKDADHIGHIIRNFQKDAAAIYHACMEYQINPAERKDAAYNDQTFIIYRYIRYYLSMYCACPQIFSEAIIMALLQHMRNSCVL